jgi:ribonuclease P protein component
MAPQGLPRSRRLRSRKDFVRIQRTGQRRTSRHFVVLVAEPHGPTSTGEERLGLTVSRKVGSAVARNRVKRRIRELYRIRPVAESCRDVVVIARRGAAELSFEEAARELSDVLAQAGR